MKKVMTLGKTLSKSEQSRIMGGSGPTDYYVYCSSDNINFYVVEGYGPYSSRQDCWTYGLWNVCGILCNFSKCTGDTISCA